MRKLNKLIDNLNKGKLLIATRTYNENENLKLYLFIRKKKTKFRLESELIDLRLPTESDPLEEEESYFDNPEELFRYIENKHQLTLFDFASGKAK